jgi:hypothetical protein
MTDDQAPDDDVGARILRRINEDSEFAVRVGDRLERLFEHAIATLPTEAAEALMNAQWRAHRIVPVRSGFELRVGEHLVLRGLWSELDDAEPIVGEKDPCPPDDDAGR